jgi:hypothetical protein
MNNGESYLFRIIKTSKGYTLIWKHSLYGDQYLLDNVDIEQLFQKIKKLLN